MKIDWEWLATTLRDFCAGLMVRPKTGGTYVSITQPLGSGYSRQAEEMGIRSRIVQRARGLLGTKYRLGAECEPGRRIDFIDCSELTEIIYKQESYFQRPMPDGAVFQHGFCKPVNMPLAGDLGFMHYVGKADNVVWHVGIYSGDDTVIHASASRGRVVEDPSDEFRGHKGWLGWGRHPELLGDT